MGFNQGEWAETDDLKERKMNKAEAIDYIRRHTTEMINLLLNDTAYVFDTGESRKLIEQIRPIINNLIKNITDEAKIME